MMKIIISVVFLFVPATVFAQCNLPVSKAPTLRGVSLGMLVEEVVLQFGQPTSRVKNGISYMPSMITLENNIRRTNRKIPVELDGVMNLLIGSTDERVSLISVVYGDETVKWDSAREFAAALSEKLAIPNYWTFRDDTAELSCGNWILTARYKSNSISLMDLFPNLTKVAEERKTVVEKKKAFKP